MNGFRRPEVEQAWVKRLLQRDRTVPASHFFETDRRPFSLIRSPMRTRLKESFVGALEKRLTCVVESQSPCAGARRVDSSAAERTASRSNDRHQW